MKSVNIPALANTIHPAVRVENGKAITSRVEVARVFGKQHKNVLQAIETLLTDMPADHWLNFQQTVITRENPSGGAPIKSPAYHLTRDGFTLLAMGFNGKRAMAFKLAYIDAFNHMEAELQGKAAELPPPPVPTRTLNFTFTVPANDRTSRWLLHTDRQGCEVVTELSPETHIITADQWIHRLIHSPADLNLTMAQILSITHACLNAMRTSAGTYASRLNIQPVKYTPAPRGQFTSLGMSAGTVPAAQPPSS